MCVQAFSHVCRLLAFAIYSVSLVEAGKFLEPRSLASIAERVDPELLQKLVSEVEGALGGTLRSDAKQLLEEIEGLLLPTFKVLPRNAKGKLDHATARYVLHRIFMTRHGWRIRGFQSEAQGDEHNASFGHLLQDKVPSLVQEIFEGRIGGEGWSLNDLAAFAALLEHLIGQEVAVKLRGIYNVSGVPIEDSIDPEKASQVAELYMMFFIQGLTDATAIPQTHVSVFFDNFHRMYPAWPQAKHMLQQVQNNTGLAKFGYADVTNILVEATKQFYDSLHKSQCQQTKNMLLAFEDPGSGRVQLQNFYNKAIKENKYQFTETIDYLRQNGALDDSDPLVPRVIITNYVTGQSNCVARTTYYAVCCPDDCENQFHQLELAIGKPYALPNEILDASEHTDPPGHATKLLVQRLNNIAEYNGGLVPLHGRLFAQWMHFAHPQQCNYPHTSGSVYTKTMEEWEDETGLRSGSTVAEITAWSDELVEQQSQRSVKDEVSAELSSDMWSMQEELLVERSMQQSWLRQQNVRYGTAPQRVFMIATFIAALAFLSLRAPLRKEYRHLV